MIAKAIPPTMPQVEVEVTLSLEEAKAIHRQLGPMGSIANTPLWRLYFTLDALHEVRPR